MGRVAVIAHLRPLLLAIQALDSAPPVTAKQDREIMGKKSGRHRAIRVQLLGEKGDLQGGATITLDSSISTSTLFPPTRPLPLALQPAYPIRTMGTKVTLP